jgi:hypothetical protein
MVSNIVQVQAGYAAGVTAAGKYFQQIVQIAYRTQAFLHEQAYIARQ